MTSPRALRAPWLIDPDVIQLNHGSFGARLRTVAQAQADARAELESNPTAWWDVLLADRIAAARAALADFLGAPTAGLGFVPNPTTGVNAALRTLAADLVPGDEVLMLDVAYGACAAALRRLALERGFTVRIATLPPDGSAADLREAVLSAVTDRTRLALIDHITSSSAQVLPIAEITAALEPDVRVLVDGAHAPGMVPLDVAAIGASAYVGNCHKWMCAPIGTAFVAMDARWTGAFLPAVDGHGWAFDGPDRVHAHLDHQATSDMTGWTIVPTLLAEMDAVHPDGWDGLRRRGVDLATHAQARLCEAVGTTPVGPADARGAMALVPMPADLTARGGAELSGALRGRGIEAKFTGPPAGFSLRVSAPAYLHEDDIETVAQALADLRGAR